MLERFLPPVNPDPELVLGRLENLVHARAALFTTLRRLRSQASPGSDELTALKQLRAEWITQLKRAGQMIGAQDLPEKFTHEFDRHRNWLEAFLTAAAIEDDASRAEARICFRQLPRHAVTFPVAAVKNSELEADRQGQINRMTLELFRDDNESGGSCQAHPLQAGLVLQDDAFTVAVENAWRATIEALDDPRLDGGNIVTYRAESQSDYHHLNGPSAGGAFSLAFLRLLRRQPYDPSILVIATIDRHGDFGPVSPRELPQKISAAVNDGMIDTIATVSDHTDIVRTELQRLRKTDSIQVCEIDGSDDQSQGAGV